MYWIKMVKIYNRIQLISTIVSLNCSWISILKGATFASLMIHSSSTSIKYKLHKVNYSGPNFLEILLRNQ